MFAPTTRGTTVRAHCRRMNGTIALLSLCLAVLLAPAAALAMPANPLPFTVSQPDGTRITLRVYGDEHFHWYADLKGYTVVVDQGAYVYAALDDTGRLVPTAHVVGQVDPAAAGLAPGILPPPGVRAEIRAAALPLPQKRDGPVRVPPSGTVKNLVVLCMFSDHSVGTDGRAQADYDTLFNAVGGHPTLAPTGSVRDLYLEDSYGTMTLDSTVAAWVTLPNTEAYYADGYDGTGYYPQNAQGMCEDALNLVDSLVDFGEFDTDNDGYIDAIDFIHSGYGAETGGGGGDWIWSHRWSLWALPGGQWTSNDQNGLGEYVKVYDYHTEPALWGTSGTEILHYAVIAHETGHFFGLPDLYDTNGGSRGVGCFCMMGNSWGFDSTQLNPPHFSAWCKIFLGWITPTVISTPAVYTAPQVQTNPVAYRIDVNYPSGEYLLIENRQPVGHETVLPQGGLCIWHIDEAKTTNQDEGYPGQPGWPENNNHFMVALLQADGNYDLEQNVNRGDAGDVYHAGGVSLIDETTVPNTDAYQDGIIIVTENSISNVSPSGSSMTFLFGELTSCTEDWECDDGLFCTGAETCVGSICQPGTGDPCATDEFCDEDSDSCLAVSFEDDFQTDKGWTAENLGATSGDWQRGVPVNDPSWAYDPASDSDGSGQCYLTQNEIGNTDVDGGAVRLTSPTIDMSGTGVLISYDYFNRLTDTSGGVDRLLTEINNNDGVGTWTTIAVHDTDGGLSWRNHRITESELLAAGVTLTTTMKLRFTANDADPQSIVESGLDAFVVAMESGGCQDNSDCDDGLWCNGAEICDVDQTCQPGTPPDCNDGVGCTDDSCNEGTDSCDNVPNDALCDNGLYCDGIEICDALLDCQVGTAVDCDDAVGCTDDSCNEGTDSCDNVPNDSLCDNGLYCDG
ncbi:MAG: M6 family metalloprotease domain-containing protein, partial [Phycisphaerales bacterium]